MAIDWIGCKTKIEKLKRRLIKLRSQEVPNQKKIESTEYWLRNSEEQLVRLLGKG